MVFLLGEADGCVFDGVMIVVVVVIIVFVIVMFIPINDGDDVFEVLAKEQAVHDARDAPVIDLVRPGPEFAHLGAVARARLPVRHEADVRGKGTQVNGAAKVDEAEALCGPAGGAVGSVGRVPECFLVVVGGPAEADEAVVGFEVAVQDADGVHGVDGAEELDGEEHGDALVQGARGRRRVRGVRFGQVDEVEEGALVQVGFDEVAFVGEEVHRMGFEERGRRSVGGRDVALEEGHDVEFPCTGRVFAFHCHKVSLPYVGGVFFFSEIDGCKCAFAELAFDGVCLCRRLGKANDRWHRDGGRGLVGSTFGLRDCLDVFADLWSFVAGQGSVVAVSWVR